MVKIAKNGSRNCTEKKGKSSAVSEKKGKKKQDTPTQEELNKLAKRIREEVNEHRRQMAVALSESRKQRKKIEDENLKKRLDAVGYVFLPTEGQLVDYYLRNKNEGISMDLCPIQELDDVYANHPHALAEKHPSTAEVWYFFTRCRPNTIEPGLNVHGQWVNSEKNDVFNQGKKVGVKLLLEYCEGDHESKFKMIEYQLDPVPENVKFGHWFICKLYNGGSVDVRFRP